jgi:PAS domain S-box-containing protein
MEVQLGHTAEEIKHLERCINDLIGIIAVPAVWSGGEPAEIVDTLLDLLLNMPDLDLIYVRLEALVGETPIEMFRVAQSVSLTAGPQEIGELFNRWLGDDPQKWPKQVRNTVGDNDMTVVPMRLGLQGEIGVIVAGSRRVDFPRQSERLVLSVAANQAVIGLQAAQLLSEQGRVAHELDERVAQRTRDLAAANEALQKEAAERRRAEEALRESGRESRLILDNIPGLIAVFTPGGELEFVNRQIIEYFGRSLEELRRWGTDDTTHPEDKKRVVELFTRAMASGEPFEFESRARRSDGVYRWHQSRGFPLRDTDGQIVRWYNLIIDIDERKHAEDALAASERNLKLIIDTIPALAWSTGPDGSADFFNQHYLDYLGLTAEQASGWGWTAAVHPDDLNNLAATWAGIMASEAPGEAEARLRRHDGEYRWFLFRANPLRDESGSIVKWYGTNTDIDDPKRAEAQRDRNIEELQAKQELLELAQKSAGAMAFDWHIQEEINYWSPEQEALFGLAPGTFDGTYRTWKKMMYAPDWPTVVEAIEHAHLTGKVMAEYRVVWPDGSLHWLSTNGRMFFDDEGRPLRMVGFTSDVTRRKLVEEELRRSEAFLAEGQNLARMGNFSWRVATEELTWSEQLYRIFEFEPSVPVTLELIATRVHPEDIGLLHDMVDRVQRGVSDFEYEHRLLMPDNSVKHLHLIAHRTRDEQGRLEYIGAMQDVTQRRFSEEALNEARSELARVARAMSLGVLTASIAHEVNQPLSGIITNASTCVRMLDADPPNVDGARETARRTIRDGQRAADVIKRLRALFGKKDATTESVNLNEAAREVIALSLSELQRGRVILRTELASDLPPVTGDRVQLQQVILNLLMNASDAMSGVEDRPRQLVIRTERHEGDCVRLCVQDVGVGFDPQDVGRLFEAFYTTKSGGMGIGLSVSRSIIESHHGRLWAAPNDGPGATFSFSIPRASEDVTDASCIGATRTSALTDAEGALRKA